MDGLLLKVDIKKPFRVVRPDEEGLDFHNKLWRIITAKLSGFK